MASISEMLASTPMLLVTGGLVLYLLRQLAVYFEKRAELLCAAREATAKFYVCSDKLLRDPDLPEPLKNILYELAMAVTDETWGRVAYGVLISPEKPDSVNSSLSFTMNVLRENKPQLASEFFDAVRAGFSSILLSVGHSEHTVLVTIAHSAAHSSDLMRKAAKFEGSLSGAPQLVAA